MIERTEAKKYTNFELFIQIIAKTEYFIDQFFKNSV